MTTPIAGLDEIAQNQANKYLTHNTALRQLEALAFRALSKTTTAQPGSPANGDVYIIPGSATGAAWATYTEGDVAIYNGGWSSLSPFEGLSLWISDTNQRWTYDGSGWKFESGAGTGANRPAVADALLGAMYLNTTTGIPNFNDGTNWVNASGSTV